MTEISKEELATMKVVGIGMAEYDIQRLLAAYEAMTADRDKWKGFHRELAEDILEYQKIERELEALQKVAGVSPTPHLPEKP